MSKIFEKNLIWEKVKYHWKRFAGWVTDLRNKYWRDIFFRTEFNIIALQIVFAVTISVLVAVFFNYIYKDILQTIINGISESIKSHGAFSSKDIVDSIQIIRAKNFFSFLGFILSITVIFSYIIARMTLYPTRNALKSQKRFIGDIAHELRTPLSVIKTNSEVALLDVPANSETGEVFRNIIEELDRASAIINNLLTFGNLVHPEQMKFGPVGMGSIVDTAVKKLEDLVEKKQIKLTVKKIKPNYVWGNTIALEQITINIIKNAINYNDIGGAVLVKVEPDYRGNIVFSVEDSGIGIDKKDLAHIFEPFYRADRSRNRRVGSSGLGLTIVSELVKLHSGRIVVRSILRQGTTVTVILPYSKEVPKNNDKNVEPEEEVSVDFLKIK